MRHIPLPLRDFREEVNFVSMLVDLRKSGGPVAVQSMADGMLNTVMLARDKNRIGNKTRKNSLVSTSNFEIK